VAELAARHPGTVPSDPEELARYFIFDDFPHFIRNYLAVVDLIKTAEDVRLITYEVAADMASQNIRYAELTVTPYISITDELPAEAFLEAIEDARQAASRDHGLELQWIFDIPADFGLPAAELTSSVALDHEVPGLVGFGLGGSERGFPRSMFRDQFDRARAAGLRSVPHAGETTGPDSVWEALISLGAERIEHGIAAAGDQRLLEHLVKHKIALDICLTSSVALRVVPDLDQYPIGELVAAGVTVTINTDDPPMVGTDLNNEYAIALGCWTWTHTASSDWPWPPLTPRLLARKPRLRCVPRSALTPRRQLPDRYPLLNNTRASAKSLKPLSLLPWDRSGLKGLGDALRREEHFG
jgi:aminodeoxyfutalosine deaminase